MSEQVRTAHAEAPQSDRPGSAGKGVETRQALELVAVRGRDVLGVRHLLEGVQIRARIVRVAASPTRAALAGAAGWVALAAAAYVLALGLCAALAPPPSLTLDRGVLQRLNTPHLHLLGEPR